MAKSRPSDDSRKRRPQDDPSPRAKKRREETDDDDEEEEETIRPKKKRKSDGKTGKMILRVFIGIVLSVGLVFLLYWVYSSVGFDDSMLAYLPEETYHVEGADYEDMEKNTQMTEFNTSMTGGTWKMWFGDRMSNIADKDVLKALRADVASTEDESKLEPQRRRGSVFVVKFKSTYDPKKFTDGFTDSTAYSKEELKSPDGKAYYQIYHTVNGVRNYHECFYWPDDRTLVMAKTRREMEGILSKAPGIALKDDMLTLVRKVDGQAFSVYRSFGTFRLDGNMPRRVTLEGDFIEESLRQQIQVLGTGRWVASDGNKFLYAEAQLFNSNEAANTVRKELASAWQVKRRAVLQNDAKSNFSFEKRKAGEQGKTNKELEEALTDYIANSMVYRRGAMVIVSGTIEQQKFKKAWGSMSSVFFPTGGGFGYPGGGFPR